MSSDSDEPRSSSRATESHGVPYDPEIPGLDDEFDDDFEPIPGANGDCSEPALCAYTEYVEGEDVDDLPATGEDAEGIEADVWDALYAVEDPEMPVSIVDLGLIYGVELDETEDGSTSAEVHMTLTYSGCPARNMLTDEVERAVAGVDGVDEVDLRLVWSPEWSIEMVTEQGKRDLNEFGLSV